MVDHTDTQAFDSHSHSQVSTPRIDETLQSNYGCEKEVVFDSEDEDICRTRTAGTANMSSVGNSFIDEQCGVGNKGCRVNVERTGEKKDLCMSSEESGESSQANALEFVDQFLSLNKMDLSPEIGIKKTFLEKSLPVSGKKQSQSLITSMELRKVAISKSGTFDWIDTDQHGKDDAFSKRANSPFEFVALRHLPQMEDDKAERLNCDGGRSSGNKHGQKEEVASLKKEIAVSNQSDSRYFKRIGEETCRMEEGSEMNFKNSVVEEFNDLHAESPDQQLEESSMGRDTPDMIDVGFSTQIAAEAMEALSYVPFAGCSALDADKVPSNITHDCPKGVKMGKIWSEHASIQTSDFSGLGDFATKSKRSKHSARISAKNSNNEEPDHGLAMVTIVGGDTALIGEKSDSTNSANAKEILGRSFPKSSIHRQVNETVSWNSSSSISVEQTEGELKNTCTLNQESRQSLAEDTLKMSNDQTDNPRDRAEDGIIKIRRKRSRLVGDPTKVVSATGRWSELHSNSSAEAGKNILNQKEQTSPVVTATASCSKLETWSHLKGKRKLRKDQKHSNRSINMYLPLAIVNRKGDMKSQRKAEDNNKTSCYNKHLYGKPKPVNSSSPPLHPLEKNLGKSYNEPGSAVVIANCESASICKRITPAEVDDVTFLLSSNGAEKNHKFEVSSGKNLEPLRSGCESIVNLTKGVNAASTCPLPSKYHKKSFNKNVPENSLLKELIRLGVPQSIPDFTWKDLRRRRDMALVQVLFSQHLGDDVIKQQKKISARLGISIATSPLDATHFIADRFVRTRNMLECIALGKPVVTCLWLESCRQASCLLDEKNYILRDDKKEKEIGFSMPVTLSRANQHPLLKGQRVFITPTINPNKEMIINLVKAVQGQVVEISQTSPVKDQNFQDNLLILSCDEDRSICMPFLDKGVAAYSSELLLNGIVIQKFEFERHQLFKDHAKRKQRMRKSRRDGVCFSSSS